MSRAEAKKFLISIGIEEPSDEAITNYLNSLSGEIQKEKDKAKTESAELERLKQIEKEFEDSKNASLTAEEKYQKEIQRLQEKAKKTATELNRTRAESTLLGFGVPKESLSAILDGIVHEDTEKTVAIATSLGETFKAQAEAVRKQVEADLLNGTPAPTGGASTTTTTKEQFKAMDYTERTELFQTNPTLFNQLNS